jgi:hypothetical protein
VIETAPSGKPSSTGSGPDEIGLSRYSYVSLFGIASLDALKASIFENLEFLVPQGSSGFTL